MREVRPGILHMILQSFRSQASGRPEKDLSPAVFLPRIYLGVSQNKGGGPPSVICGIVSFSCGGRPPSSTRIRHFPWPLNRQALRLERSFHQPVARSFPLLLFPLFSEVLGPIPPRSPSGLVPPNRFRTSKTPSFYGHFAVRPPLSL